MDSLSIILTIHTIMIALFPLLRRFFSFILPGDREARIINLVVFSIINLALPISIFIVFLVYSFRGTFYNSTSKIFLFGSKNYLFELGFRITPIQLIAYSFIFLILSVISYRTIMNREKISFNYIDKISVLCFALILLIYSPNFFQLTLFLLILDALFLNFIHASFQKFSTNGSRNLKQLVFAFVIGNSFLFSSFGLLIKLSRSFDFFLIFQDINLYYNLTHPFFVIVCSLFLVGLVAKSSLFPFHEWKRKAWNTDISWVFQIDFFYISIIMLFLFITPFNSLIFIIADGIVWYATIILLFCSILTVIIRKIEVVSTLLLSIYSSIILFTIGVGYYFAAFQQIVILPFIFSILIIYLMKESKENMDEYSGNNSILKSLLLSIPLLISGLAIIGVPPLNNSLIAITYTLDHPTILSGIGLLICSIISFALIVYFISTILYKVFNQRSKIRISLLDIFVIVESSLMIILFGVLVPYLLPIEHLQIVMLSESLLFLKSVLPIAVIGFVFTLLYLLLVNYFKSFYENISQKTEPLNSLTQKIIAYDFLFEFSALVYMKVILPTTKWIKRKIVMGFLVGIVFHYSYESLLILARSLRKLIFEIIIPNIKKAFVKTSKFIRSLEGLKLRNQLHLAVAFLLILIIIVVVYHFGGNI